MATVVLAGENHLMIAFLIFYKYTRTVCCQIVCHHSWVPKYIFAYHNSFHRSNIEKIVRVSDQITTSDDVAFFHSTCSMHLTLQMCRSILLRAHGCCARVSRSGLLVTGSLAWWKWRAPANEHSWLEIPLSQCRTYVLTYMLVIHIHQKPDNSAVFGWALWAVYAILCPSSHGESTRKERQTRLPTTLSWLWTLLLSCFFFDLTNLAASQLFFFG